MSHKAKDKEEEVQLDTKNIVSLRSNVFNPTITENEEEENEEVDNNEDEDIVDFSEKFDLNMEPEKKPIVIESDKKKIKNQPNYQKRNSFVDTMYRKLGTKGRNNCFN